MKVKEVKAQDFLEKKLVELNDIKASLSEFEGRLREVINDKNMTESSKLLLIRSAFQRTLGGING